MQTDADARAGRLRETQTDSAERRLKASLAAPRLTQALPCPRPRLMAERRKAAEFGGTPGNKDRRAGSTSEEAFAPPWRPR